MNTSKVLGQACSYCGCNRHRKVQPREGLTYRVCMGCSHCCLEDAGRGLQASFEQAQVKYFGEDTILPETENALLYDEALEARIRLAKKLLHEGDKALEVGPGSGAFLRWLADQHLNLSAVEHSDVLAARIGVPPDVKVYCGDFEYVSLEPGAFDIVFSFHVIEHVPSPQHHLSRAFDLVREGGCAVIATPNAASWPQRMVPWLCPNFDSAHLNLFSPKSLANACERSGWYVEQTLSLEFSSSWLRVASKALRRIRSEDEESTSGKYALQHGYGVRALVHCFQTISAPVRWIQGKLGAGNDLFVVVRKLGGPGAARS